MASADYISLYRGDRDALAGSLDRIQRAASVILAFVSGRIAIQSMSPSGASMTRWLGEPRWGVRFCAATAHACEVPRFDSGAASTTSPRCPDVQRPFVVEWNLNRRGDHCHCFSASDGSGWLAARSCRLSARRRRRAHSGRPAGDAGRRIVAQARLLARLTTAAPWQLRIEMRVNEADA